MKLLIKIILFILIHLLINLAKANVSIDCYGPNFIVEPKIELNLTQNKIFIPILNSYNLLYLYEFRNLSSKISNLNYKEYNLTHNIEDKLQKISNFINSYDTEFSFNLSSIQYNLIQKILYSDKKYCSHEGQLDVFFLDTLIDIKNIYKVDNIYIIFSENHLIIFDSKQNLFFIYKTVE